MATLSVVTNSFRVTEPPKGTFTQYDVAITYQVPKPKPGKIFRERKRLIIHELQIRNPSLFTPRGVYDGEAIMWSTNGSIGARTFEITHSQTIFNVTLTPVNTIHATEIQSLFSQQRSTKKAEIINLLQLIVTQAPALASYKPIKRNCYYSDRDHRPTELGGGLVAWRGYFQSVRPSIERLYVNVDVSTAIVYRSGSLLDDVVADFLGLRNPNIRDIISRLSDPRVFASIARFVKGLLVQIQTVKTPGNWEFGKRISGIVERAGAQMFIKDNVSITVQEYFYQKYGYKLRFPEAFGVRIGQHAIFPAELCKVMPGQVYKKRLGEKQQKLMSRLPSPFDRLRDIQTAVSGNFFNYDRADFLGQMTISRQPERLTGKILPHVDLRLGGEVKKTSHYGKWDVHRDTYYKPAEFRSMAVVTFVSAPNAADNLKQFLSALILVMRKRGMTFRSEAQNTRIIAGHPGNIEGAFSSLVQEAPELILVILPASAGDLKKQVKHFALSLPQRWPKARWNPVTQCLREGKYDRSNDQYCNNVALKINAKLGGKNSILAGSRYLNKATMVMGVDVTHPGPGTRGKPSVIGLVASLDETATIYTANAKVQPPRQEYIENLSVEVQAALRFRSRVDEGFHINHVVIFRDGVSEGEYEKIMTEEVEAIANVLKNYPGKPAKLTFIVVTKRHHVRFFISDAMARQDPKLKNNCPAGTVVDADIVSPDYVNFYLQSHSGLIGTSCPSHYVVLRNDLGWSKEHLQAFCYEMCHTYASASRSVSIPAPVYYADKVCSSANWLFSEDLESESTSGDFDLSQWQNDLKVPATTPTNMLYFL